MMDVLYLYKFIFSANIVLEEHRYLEYSSP